MLLVAGRTSAMLAQRPSLLRRLTRTRRLRIMPSHPAVTNVTVAWLALNTRLLVGKCLSLLTLMRTRTKFSASVSSAHGGKKTLIRRI